jgi:DNA-binding NtrC family response regulator
MDVDVCGKSPRESGSTMLVPTCLSGRSLAVREIDDEATRIAALDIKVLITGEAGAGKQTIARLIHERGPRADRPFVTVDCGSIPDSTFESDWLDPVNDVGGTLVLRAVDDMSAHKQDTLYRYFDAITAGDGNHRDPRRPRLRVLAASRGRLFDGVEAGTFRQDLFYRLNTVHMCVPSLRDRCEDVPVLFDYFVREFCDVQQCAVPRVAPETLQALTAYSWPENVRELKQVSKRVVMKGDGQVQFESIRVNRPLPACRPDGPVIGSPQPRSLARPRSIS